MTFIEESKNILVMPTIREHCLRSFLAKWQETDDWKKFDEVIIVEDNPEPTFELEGVTHYSWQDIERDLGADRWIISRRDSAIRSYGFWKAHQRGATTIFTLDDDCYPVQGERFVAGHLDSLTGQARWVESVPGTRTRGLPYKNLGTLENVQLSVGSWEGVPDHDAIHMLTDHLPPLKLPETRIMPRGQYFPVCGMNMAFKRDFAPLSYFPLMGLNQPFARFDDIWFGIIAKKVCDHLDWSIACGRPYIYHSKASDPFVNLVKEAPGVKANETFWRTIDAIQLSGTNPATCMAEVGLALSVNKDDYIAKLGKAIKIWAGLFE